MDEEWGEASETSGYHYWSNLLEVMDGGRSGSPHGPPLVWCRYRQQYVAGSLRAPFPNPWDFLPSGKPLDRTPALDMADLSPREEEVLMLMTQGLSNAEVAHKLGISESCVRSHQVHIHAFLKRAKG